MIEHSEKDGKLSFKVHVVPRASRSEVVGQYDGALRVRIAASPVDGAANDELIRTLARAFGLPRTAVEISAGHSSRLKQVRITGAKQSDLAELVNQNRSPGFEWWRLTWNSRRFLWQGKQSLITEEATLWGRGIS